MLKYSFKIIREKNRRNHVWKRLELKVLNKVKKVLLEDCTVVVNHYNNIHRKIRLVHDHHAFAVLSISYSVI